MTNTNNSFILPSHGSHVFTPDVTTLVLRIPLAAIGDHNEKTTFKLTSTDEPKYEKILTLKDDLIEGDDSAELMFPDVYTHGKFTLEIDPENGKPIITLFKEKSFSELSNQK